MGYRTPFAAALVLGALMPGLPATIAMGADTTAEPAVKLSRSGICHDRTSPNYRQLATYEGFSSIEACLKAGGRLPGNAQRRSFVPRPGNPSWWQQFDPFWLAGGAIAIVLSVSAALRAWLSRRGSPAETIRSADDKAIRSADDLERRRWEGHKLEKRDPGDRSRR